MRRSGRVAGALLALLLAAGCGVRTQDEPEILRTPPPPTATPTATERPTLTPSRSPTTSPGGSPTAPSAAPGPTG